VIRDLHDAASPPNLQIELHGSPPGGVVEGSRVVINSSWPQPISAGKQC
jgi:hypothetical protein